VAVQEVRWDEGGTQSADDYAFYGNENADHHLGTGLCKHKGIISVVKRIEFIGDRLSYLMLRGCWCDDTVLNVHAPTEDRCDDTKDSFMTDWSVYWISSRSTT
jgi:hypothetical protein